MNDPIIIHSLDPEKLVRYAAYLEAHGCRMAGEREAHLLYIPEGASCITFGPYEGYTALRVGFPDQGFFYVYTQLTPLLSMLHIPEEAFLVGV